MGIFDNIDKDKGYLGDSDDDEEETSKSNLKEFKADISKEKEKISKTLSKEYEKYTGKEL